MERQTNENMEFIHHHPTTSSEACCMVNDETEERKKIPPTVYSLLSLSLCVCFCLRAINSAMSPVMYTGAVLGKNIWGGADPWSFGRQRRLSKITIEPTTSTSSRTTVSNCPVLNFRGPGCTRWVVVCVCVCCRWTVRVSSLLTSTVFKASLTLRSSHLQALRLTPTYNRHSQVVYTASPLTQQHTQPFHGSLDFVWDNPGEPVPEETFRHLLDFLEQDEDNTGRCTNNLDRLPPHPD